MTEAGGRFMPAPAGKIPAFAVRCVAVYNAPGRGPSRAVPILHAVQEMRSIGADNLLERPRYLRERSSRLRRSLQGLHQNLIQRLAHHMPSLRSARARTVLSRRGWLVKVRLARRVVDNVLPIVRVASVRRR